MNEEKSFVPSLTLDPQPVAAAASVQEAPEEKAEVAPVPAVEDVKFEKPDISMLTEAE